MTGTPIDTTVALTLMGTMGHFEFDEALEIVGAHTDALAPGGFLAVCDKVLAHMDAELGERATPDMRLWHGTAARRAGWCCAPHGAARLRSPAYRRPVPGRLLPTRGRGDLIPPQRGNTGRSSANRPPRPDRTGKVKGKAPARPAARSTRRNPVEPNARPRARGLHPRVARAA